MGEHNEKQQKDETSTKHENEAMSATEKNTGTEHDWNFGKLCKTTFKNLSILAHSYKIY